MAYPYAIFCGKGVFLSPSAALPLSVSDFNLVSNLLSSSPDVSFKDVRGSSEVVDVISALDSGYEVSL